jgi:hypothetical protein
MERESKFSLIYEFVELVQSNGDNVALHSPECVIWTLEHNKCCNGCPSELGCNKAIKMTLIAMIPKIYHPKDYNDFVNMENRIQDLLKKTLEAKSPEELTKIPSR